MIERFIRYQSESSHILHHKEQLIPTTHPPSDSPEIVLLPRSSAMHAQTWYMSVPVPPCNLDTRGAAPAHAMYLWYFGGLQASPASGRRTLTCSPI